MRQCSQGWCTDDPEGGRWEGGSGWGAHVYPADSCEYMAKKLQYCKVI